MKNLAKWLPALWLTGWLAASALSRAHAVDFNLTNVLRSPSDAHPFGFDCFGRDLLATVLSASATSVLFSAIAVASALAFSLAVGCGISVAPERLRFLALRGLDFFLAFPGLLFALAWAALRGPGWDTLAFALLIWTIPPLVRLIYATARETLARDFVLAARSLGAAPGRIVFRHIFPSVLPLCRVKLPNLFANALMAEATLSFLGIGAPIGRETWGSLLAEGKDYLIEAPHIAIAAGLPLMLTVLSLQLISENWSHSLAASGRQK